MRAAYWWAVVATVLVVGAVAGGQWTLNRAVDEIQETTLRATCIGLYQDRLLILAALDAQRLEVALRPDGRVEVAGTIYDDLLPPLDDVCAGVPPIEPSP